MEAVELVVYMAIALIVGVLILGFISGWDAPGVFVKLRGMFSGNDGPGYREVPHEEFSKAVVSFWDSCGLGLRDASSTIYVTGEGSLSKEDLFVEVQRASLCKSLQSAEYECGGREDVEAFEIDAPTVVVMTCVAETGTLVISS